MRVWLTQTGEPLPTDGPGVRLFRTGILSAALAERGHEGWWWTSSVAHSRKRQRCGADDAVDLGDRLRIMRLRAAGYARHVSLGRLLSHRDVARRFLRAAASAARPDVIVCSLPTLELSLAATAFGRRQGIPVVLDVRDLWPDIFLDRVPSWGRGLSRLALFPFFSMARRACAAATAIIAPTETYVDWGVRKAGRRRTPWDREFPFGYSEQAPSPEDRLRAEAFWRERGVPGAAGEFLVCFFGTMGRQFDLETVIEAARILQAQGRPIRFVLCGDGDHLPRYRRLAADCANVLFPGWVSAPEIWRLMRIASVGLAPYHSSESFVIHLPNKPIEYMSAGLPIVSSLQGILRDLLAAYDCGVNYGNARAGELVSVLGELQARPERLQELSRNAYALFKGRFTAETVYGGMIDYLRSIAERRHEDPGGH
ncbi:MAG: glycosyltransferase family 4 protein [Elusimicrobia bacterium]|nr:glycosyltransferase family 4 protein [Elusimicrobiota bacterium]